MNWQTLGHQNQKIFLENALKNKNLSHAYLFTGPKQIGKRTLAMEFASNILEVKDPVKFNPDLIIAGGEQNKIENIRELIRELSLRPYQYQYKIAIIDNFENVTEEAANSILKTLEEPTASTIIILIADNKKKLLPTILSRVQALHFSRSAEGIGTLSGAEQAQANLFDGRIGKKIEFDQNETFRENILANAAGLADLKNKDAAERILAIKDYAENESKELTEILENWLDIEHYAVIKNSPELYKNLKSISEAIIGIKQNFNKKLVLERLFLNLV